MLHLRNTRVLALILGLAIGPLGKEVLATSPPFLSAPVAEEEIRSKLVSEPWVLVAWDQAVTEEMTVNYFEQLDACRRDDIMQLNPDGTFAMQNGDLKCGEGEFEQLGEGQWTYSQEVKPGSIRSYGQISQTFQGGKPVVWEVKSISEERLELISWQPDSTCMTQVYYTLPAVQAKGEEELVEEENRTAPGFLLTEVIKEYYQKDGRFQVLDGEDFLSMIQPPANNKRYRMLVYPFRQVPDSLWFETDNEPPTLLEKHCHPKDVHLVAWGHLLGTHSERTKKWGTDIATGIVKYVFNLGVPVMPGRIKTLVTDTIAITVRELLNKKQLIIVGVNAGIFVGSLVLTYFGWKAMGESSNQAAGLATLNFLSDLPEMALGTSYLLSEMNSEQLEKDAIENLTLNKAFSKSLEEIEIHSSRILPYDFEPKIMLNDDGSIARIAVQDEHSKLRSGSRLYLSRGEDDGPHWAWEFPEDLAVGKVKRDEYGKTTVEFSSNTKLHQKTGLILTESPVVGLK